jgi:GTP-binding protein Era
VSGEPEGQAGPAGTRSGLVSLIGRPNVGKSTLLNRLVGAKVSIVSDKPQTTRNRIAGVMTRGQHQVIFLDTPGIHRPLHAMNERMVRAAFQALEDVDGVTLLTDATQPFGRGDAFVLEELARRRSGAVQLLVNKIDLVRKEKLLPLVETWSQRYSFARVFLVSALTGDGVEDYIDAVLELLPEAPFWFPEDQVSDVSLRFMAQEIVREKILLATHAEIPYASGVLLQEFEEDPDRRLVRIEADILVDRDSQKGIIIGRGGSMLKRLGSEARTELEEILGQKVFLGLRVKVRRGWRDNLGLLERLGLGR